MNNCQILFFLLLFIWSNEKCGTASRCTQDSEVLNKLIANYDRTTKPVDLIKVKIELFLATAPHLSTDLFSMEAHPFVMHTWRDPRLSYSSLNPCSSNISVHHDRVSSFWNPEICAINSQEMEIHRSPVPNLFLSLFANGTVFYSYRAKIRVPCKSDCAMNETNCSIELESCLYNADQVRLEWSYAIIQASEHKTTWTCSEVKVNQQSLMYPVGSVDSLIATFKFKPSNNSCSK